MLKKITILPVILILLATILTQASGSTKCANVTLPAFDIRLNGVKMMIINNKGNVIFETSDVVKYVKINNNKIFYIP